MEYVKLKPPASTKSYKSAGKLVALEQLDVHTVLQIIDPSPTEFQTMRVGAAIIGAVGASRGRKNKFPSPCDLVDMELHGTADWDEPAWTDRTMSRRSIWMLRGVDRLRKLIAERDRSNDVFCRLECPVCHESAVGVSMGPRASFNGSRAILGPLSAMVHLTVECDCQGIQVSDIYQFERKALDKCGS